MKPWISIVVPVYNVEDYLERCVESLLRQSFKNIEIILVDDGSTDSSGKKCDYFAKKYENINSVHKINGGLGSARNEGMKYVNGEYVAFVDSDDWMDEETYQILYKKSQKSIPDIISYGCKKIINNEVISEIVAKFDEKIYLKEDIENLILPDSIAQKQAFNQVSLPVQLSACMCVYKTSFLKKNDIHFESERVVLNEDWLFNICCLCRAESFLVVHRTFYNYDTREASLSMSFKADSYKRKRNLYKRYKEELETTGNLNSLIEQRLKIFWIESIYSCYIIELCAPRIDRQRIEEMFSDSEFKQEMKKLNLKNCSLKGIFFKYAVKYRLHFIFKIIYKLKKKM